MKAEINWLRQQLSNQKAVTNLEFLKKWFYAYSSKGHLSNVVRDLNTIKRLTPPPQRVLDFGCGIGVQSFLLAKNGYDVTGLETTEDKSLRGFLKGNAEAVIESREKGIESIWSTISKTTTVRFQFYDGVNIPFQENHFDTVVAYAVLEHIPKPDIPNILRQINRVLKRNGLFYIFQLPQRTSYTEFIARKIGLQSHEFLWTLKSMIAILEENGFSLSFSEKVDMIINHPYKVINPLFPVLHLVNEVLIHTPLSYFAHHLTIVSKKK